MSAKPEPDAGRCGHVYPDGKRCGLLQRDHPTETCRACNGNALHHSGVFGPCWRGLARMADAKRHTRDAEARRHFARLEVWHPPLPYLSEQQRDLLDDFDGGTLLKDNEREALERYPVPEFLHADGYRQRIA